MVGKYISQKDFIDIYDKGQKEFSNILLQWIDLSGKTFEDIIVKDSNIMFCTIPPLYDNQPFKPMNGSTPR